MPLCAANIGRMPKALRDLRDALAEHAFADDAEPRAAPGRGSDDRRSRTGPTSASARPAPIAIRDQVATQREDQRERVLGHGVHRIAADVAPPRRHAPRRPPCRRNRCRSPPPRRACSAGRRSSAAAVIGTLLVMTMRRAREARDHLVGARLRVLDQLVREAPAAQPDLRRDRRAVEKDDLVHGRASVVGVASRRFASATMRRGRDAEVFVERLGRARRAEARHADEAAALAEIAVPAEAHARPPPRRAPCPRRARAAR